MKFCNDERGAASVIGICWLAVMLFFSGAVYALCENEARTVERFLMGQQLKYSAEDGVALGCKKLLNDQALQNTILNSGVAKKYLTITDNDISCDIYFSHKGNQLEVLAVSSNKKAEVRCLGIIKKNDEGYYFDHRER